jgi:hypothetical protein
MTEAADLLRVHTDRFNEGVRTGDFGPMIEHFAEDAEMVFDGVPMGPFVGRAAIADAYASRPPDDEILILSSTDEGDAVVAGYGWRKDGGTAAGRMILTARQGQIARLVVTFES